MSVSDATAKLTTSSLTAADPFERDTPDRGARSADRSTPSPSTPSPAASTGTDATPLAAGESDRLGGQAAAAVTDPASEERVHPDAAAQAHAAAEAAAQAQAEAAAAQAQADAQAKAAAVAKAQAWVAPIGGGYTLTSGFGMRWGSMHPGQDFAIPVGSEVHALSSGTVVFAGWEGGYGNKLEIQYWDGTVSWFGHNSKLLVKTGDAVTSGETVSLSGNTGHSTGPHLHLEIHPGNGAPVPPIPWLTAKGIMP